MKKIPFMIAILAYGAFFLMGCGQNPPAEQAKPQEETAAPTEHAEEHSHEHERDHSCEAEHHEHESAHGGTLNAMVTCENGHAEVKAEGDTLKLWFVGGGSDTTKSVRVPDKSIELKLKSGKVEKSITLLAKPLELAGEKIGDASYFEGKADWLKGMKEFEAVGSAMFKGKKTPIKIIYPGGYDPD